MNKKQTKQMIRGHDYVVELTSGEVHVGTFLCCDDGAHPTLIMEGCAELDLLEVERVFDLTEFFSSLLPREIVDHVAALSAG